MKEMFQNTGLFEILVQSYGDGKV